MFSLTRSGFDMRLARLLFAAASGILLMMCAPGMLVAQDAATQNAATQNAATQNAAAPKNVASAGGADQRLFYVAGEAVMLYNTPDETRPVQRLEVTTPVHRLRCADDWCEVRTDDGKTGYLPKPAISNVWIRASKEDRRVYLYRGTHLLKTFNADFGYNAFSDKERRGSQRLRDHWRTPEGQFYVVRRNPNSQFYKALVLNYPTASDARRGYKNGLISRSERDAIVRAEEGMRMPPMNTELGGWVEIHGDGTGAATNWTQGCVAVTNSDMNTLWWWAKVGTPVLVE